MIRCYERGLLYSGSTAGRKRRRWELLYPVYCIEFMAVGVAGEGSCARVLSRKRVREWNKGWLVKRSSFQPTLQILVACRDPRSSASVDANSPMRTSMRGS